MKLLIYFGFVLCLVAIHEQSSFPIRGPEMNQEQSHLDLEQLVNEYLTNLDSDTNHFHRQKKKLKTESQVEPLYNHRRKSNPDEQTCQTRMNSFESNRMVDSKASLQNGAKFLRVEKINLNSDFSLKELQSSCVDICCSSDECDTGLLSLMHGENGYRCYLFKCSGHCIFIKHKDYVVLRQNSPEQDLGSDIQTGHKDHMESGSYKEMTGSSISRINFDDGQTQTSNASDHAQAIIILIIGCLLVSSFFIYIALQTKYLSKRLRIMNLLKMERTKSQSQNVDVDGDYLINGLYL